MNCILLQVHAEDQDLGYNGELVYVISDGDPDASFSINMTTGLVSVMTGLDRGQSASSHPRPIPCQHQAPRTRLPSAAYLDRDLG